MKTLRIALVGFGNVGRRFAALLPGPYGRVLRGAGVVPRVTGIATARHGVAIDGRGLPLARCLRLVEAGRSLDGLHRGRPVPDGRAFIDAVPADVLIEITPLDPTRGEPATSHVRRALGRGLHVVTANKGPVAFAFGALRRLAARRGRAFLHESAVMDGAPIFNLVRSCLPGVTILGFRGVLNSTTTRVLCGMEAGATAEEALAEAQRLGIAEANPRNDLDGWDAAVKGCALANALMGADVEPMQVDRRGIGAIGPAEVAAAARDRARLRLVVRGMRRGRAVDVVVRPERIPIGDLLVTPGADGIVVLETDLMAEIAIWEGAGGVDQTAYGLLADLTAVATRMNP